MLAGGEAGVVGEEVLVVSGSGGSLPVRCL